MRLGQRLSGGVGFALGLAKLRSNGKTIELSTAPANAALIGPAVRKRLEKLADALGCPHEIASS